MPGFDHLSPQVVISSVEAAFDLKLLSLVVPYPSYVNRVYGVEDDNGAAYVVKFYRPGRWSIAALREEHRFIREMADADIPVVRPMTDADGDTLAEMILDAPEGRIPFHFALFPKRAGRLFDAEDDEAWHRIGVLCGRIHTVGATAKADHRPIITPVESTMKHIRAIIAEAMVPDELGNEFSSLAQGAVDSLVSRFENCRLLRVHGDLHRANILDRGDEGLLLIDLDDMAVGPAVQDLWLLLPGYREDVGRELGLMAEGYEEFRRFPWEELDLIEPLRFMRMVHFIAWCGKQRYDRDFASHFPDWGSRSWWIKELEDLKDQIGRLV